MDFLQRFSMAASVCWPQGVSSLGERIPDASTSLSRVSVCALFCQVTLWFYIHFLHESPEHFPCHSLKSILFNILHKTSKSTYLSSRFFRFSGHRQNVASSLTVCNMYGHWSFNLAGLDLTEYSWVDSSSPHPSNITYSKLNISTQLSCPSEAQDQSLPSMFPQVRISKD